MSKGSREKSCECGPKWSSVAEEEVKIWPLPLPLLLSLFPSPSLSSSLLPALKHKHTYIDTGWRGMRKGMREGKRNRNTESRKQVFREHFYRGEESHFWKGEVFINETNEGPCGFLLCAFLLTLNCFPWVPWSPASFIKAIVLFSILQAALSISNSCLS